MQSVQLTFSEAPYPGLRPFRPDEADIFFGRDRQTDELLQKLGQHRFLAIVGPSGCGKSSLVAAGLMPALAAGFMVQAGSQWRTALFRPGERPLQSLAHALMAADILDEECAARPDARHFLHAALRRGRRGLVEVVRGSALESDANLLVLVDQFEELFRIAAPVDRDEAEAFASLLITSALAPGERIYVAITMRSERLGDCTPYYGLPEAINKGLFLTPHLTRDECATAITGPARVFEAEVEPTLVNRLLNDFGPAPDQLPQLQHALLRMWDRHERERQSGAKTVLKTSDYEAICTPSGSLGDEDRKPTGGLSLPLSIHADEVLAELNADDQRLAKIMIRRLSDCETPECDGRSPARVSEIAELAGAAVDRVICVADAFRRRGRNFLTSSEDGDLKPESVLDISHESLLRQWGQAVSWLKDEASDVRLYRGIQEAAGEWQADPAALWGGSKLDRALEWRKRATPVWARRYGREEDFVGADAFLQASERARAEERARQERADAEERARQERADAEERARQENMARLRIRRARRIAAVSVLSLVVASLAFIGRWLLYVRPTARYFPSYVRVEGAPRGLGLELTEEQRRRRPVTFRIETAGLWGEARRMDVVNSRDEPTEVLPDYYGAARGRQLATSSWRYTYDADGMVASELQYTRRGELVQGKIHVETSSRECATGSERLVYFIGPEGTAAPMRGSTEESAYYWAERLCYSKNGFEERISYLGPLGEPVPGGDREFTSRMEYDEQGNLTALTSLDRLGRPMNDAFGNAVLIVVPGGFGNAVVSVALNAEGKPTKVVEGWAVRQSMLDPYGNERELAYFDENLKPITTAGGWHMVRFERDERGSIRERRYFDEQGRPTRDATFQCFGTKERYDALNRQVRWTCVDASGASTKSTYGYFSTAWEYDEESGQPSKIEYLDANNKSTIGEGGYASAEYTYEQGRIRTVKYLGLDGKLMKLEDGYAQTVTTRAEAGRIEETRYLGVDGRPAVIKPGYSGRRRMRDIWWNVVEEVYLGQDGKPVTREDGYAGWVGTFDGTGQRIELRYVGTQGGAVFSKGGYAGWTSRFDDLGRETSVRYLGLGGEPIATTDGYAGWDSQFDRLNRVKVRTYVNQRDEPVSSVQGEAGWTAEYDALGNETERRYLNIDRKPTLHVWDDLGQFTGQGYARVSRTYNRWGNVTSEEYRGVDDKPVARPDGWSQAKHEYDDLGRNRRTSYFGVDGRPAKVRAGYWAVTRAYDERNNPTDIRYFDVDGKPGVCRDGYAHLHKTYDLFGRVLEQSLFGAEEEPVALSDGTHRSVKTWDDQGREAAFKWFGVAAPGPLGRIEYQYDKSGNMSEERNLKPDGKPVATSTHPCATLRWRANQWRDIEEETCLDADGALSPNLSNGGARIEYAYDLPGVRARERYFDAKNRPFTTWVGHAGVRYNHDAFGRQTECIYLNGRGEAVLTKLGYARVTNEYDASGNPNAEAYFLADGSPTRPIARMESDFNAVRRKVQDRYLGPGGKPAALMDGQHITLYEYDEFGNVRTLRYLDIKRRPTRGYARFFDASWQLCGRWVAVYNLDGEREGNGKCEHEIPDE